MKLQLQIILICLLAFYYSCIGNNNSSPELKQLLCAIDLDQENKIREIISINKDLTNHIDSDYTIVR